MEVGATLKIKGDVVRYDDPDSYVYKHYTLKKGTYLAGGSFTESKPRQSIQVRHKTIDWVYKFDDTIGLRFKKPIYMKRLAKFWPEIQKKCKETKGQFTGGWEGDLGDGQVLTIESNRFKDQFYPRLTLGRSQQVKNCSIKLDYSEIMENSASSLLGIYNAWLDIKEKLQHGEHVAHIAIEPGQMNPNNDNSEIQTGAATGKDSSEAEDSEEDHLKNDLQKGRKRNVEYESDSEEESIPIKKSKKKPAKKTKIEFYSDEDDE